jgi:hypothetical protein
MPDGEAPRVAQVPLLVIEIVPVTVGAGLTPGDAISVEPSGIPTGPTVEPVVMPSGEVTPMVGVGLATPPTCAMAGLQMTSSGRTAAINENFTCTLRFAASQLVRSYWALVGARGFGTAWIAPERTRKIAFFMWPQPIQLLFVGRWTARTACSIKYAFIVVACFPAPIQPCAAGNPVA